MSRSLDGRLIFLYFFNEYSFTAPTDNWCVFQRQSINMDKVFSTDAVMHEEPSSSTQLPMVKKEEPEDDFTFDEPAQKKQKTTSAPQGKAVNSKSAHVLRDELQMNWDPIQVRS